MKRLTEKFRDGYTYSIKRKDMNIHGDSLIGEFPDKLGQLEDIEEELGIDLIPLFKALKNGCYMRFGKEIRSIPSEFVRTHCSCLFVDSNMPKLFESKEYGKTWALTKEELLCD